MRRFWLSVCGVVFALLSAGAVAQTPTDSQSTQSALSFPVPIDLSVMQPLSQRPSPAESRSLFKADSIAVLQDAPSELTVEQVAALPAAVFAPFNANKAYQLSDKKALWLHFRAIGPAPTPTLNWTFELPKPFVDKVELYHRNAQRNWDKQQSGEWVPQATWAIRGLHPQFYLPELAAGSNDFYVRVSQLVPLRFDVTLKPLESANFDNQNALLVSALITGLMLFVALFASVLSLVYRNQIYGWYAVYAMFALLAVVSYVGLGYYAFWPASSQWAEISPSIFLILALAAQLQFCVVLLVDSRRNSRTRLALSLSALLLAASAVAVALLPQNAIDLRVKTSLAVIAVAVLLILAVSAKAVFDGRAIARLWIVAYVPLLVFISLTLVEQFGLAPLPWLPYNGIVAAVGFEVLVLLIALHMHVKSNHEWDVRQTTLIELDPLTGFLAPLYFPDTLAQLWSQARHQREDIAVAYIRADIGMTGQRVGPPMTEDEIVLRCVRMLRMVTRPDDTVARIGGNMFAILMPRMSTGSNFAGKLSRLVALGVMRDTDDALQKPIRFRIAATTFSSFSGTSAQLDEALKKMLGSLTAASERTIEFVRG